MQKPNGYENTAVQGEFEPAELGGHLIRIKKVEERKNKSGGDMLVVFYDFDEKDVQPGYYGKLFNDDVRPDKKWPNGGTAYINVTYNGECTKAFKTFCTCAEKSNTAFMIGWNMQGDMWGEQFKNKLIGGVYGLVEEEYNGKTNKRPKLRWFCTADKAGSANIPRPKLLNDNEPGLTSGQKPMTDDEILAKIL